MFTEPSVIFCADGSSTMWTNLKTGAASFFLLQNQLNVIIVMSRLVICFETVILYTHIDSASEITHKYIVTKSLAYFRVSSVNLSKLYSYLNSCNTSWITYINIFLYQFTTSKSMTPLRYKGLLGGKEKA